MVGELSSGRSRHRFAHEQRVDTTSRDFREDIAELTAASHRDGEGLEIRSDGAAESTSFSMAR